MKRNYKTLTLMVIIIAVLALMNFKAESDSGYKMMNDKVIKRLSDGALYIKGKINLKFKDDFNLKSSNSFGITKLDAILQSNELKKITQPHPINFAKRMKGDSELSKIYTVFYTSNEDPGELSRQILSQNKNILDWAEPDYVMTADFNPNDPSYGSQWFLPKISAGSAWDLSQGDTNVIIGMVDTGDDMDHPDQTANLKRNWLENPTNGIDDDGNGYVDDYRGWDFAGSDYQNLSQDNDPNVYGANCDHGSHTAGCASEVTNNNTGGAGIGFKCKLYISKHGADNDYTGGGVSYLYNTNSGIVYLSNYPGIKVINCSYGGSTYSSYTQLVVSNAWANGIVITASAGNEGLNTPRYPASYDNVVSVASTNSSDQKSWFSNYHSSVDISAPGSGIYSTLWNNTYASYDGTSMSAPIVAGVVALIRSKFPAYTPEQAVNKLKAGVDDIYTINPSYVGLLGTGRVNALKCLQGGSDTLIADFTANTTSISPGGSVNFTDQSTGGPTTWSWTFQGGSPGSSTQQNPSNIVYNTIGTYDVSLTVTKNSLVSTRNKPGYITVSAGSVNKLFESFENTTFPPTGWSKINPLSGTTGWYRIAAGTTPVPGFTGGYITSPPGGGNAVAFCNYITGNSNGGSSGPCDQWLVTPQLTNVQPGDSLTFYLRKFGSYVENFSVKISTTTPTVAAMTIPVMMQNYSASDSGWVMYKYLIGSLVPAGSNIYIGFREYVSDVAIDGASFSLDLVRVTGLNVGITKYESEIPSVYSLSQNYPNPFNPVTNIKFTLPKSSNVILNVYDITGKLVSELINDTKNAGTYVFQFDASSLSSGTYFYRLTAGDYTETKRMLIIK